MAIAKKPAAAEPAKEKVQALQVTGIAQWSSLLKPRAASKFKDRMGKEKPISARYKTDLIVTNKKVAMDLIKLKATVKTLVKTVTDKKKQIAAAEGIDAKYIGFPVISVYRDVFTKDGATMMPPIIKDSKNNRVADLIVGGKSLGIGNGSKLVLALFPNPYVENGTDLEKTRLVLLGAQILDLVPYVPELKVDFVVQAGGFELGDEAALAPEAVAVEETAEIEDWASAAAAASASDTDEEFNDDLPD